MEAFWGRLVCFLGTPKANKKVVSINAFWEGFLGAPWMRLGNIVGGSWGDLGCSALEAPPSFSSCMLLKINLLKLSILDLSWRSPGMVLKAFDASFGRILHICRNLISRLARFCIYAEN